MGKINCPLPGVKRLSWSLDEKIALWWNGREVWNLLIDGNGGTQGNWRKGTATRLHPHGLQMASGLPLSPTDPVPHKSTSWHKMGPKCVVWLLRAVTIPILPGRPKATGSLSAEEQKVTITSLPLERMGRASGDWRPIPRITKALAGPRMVVTSPSVPIRQVHQRFLLWMPTDSIREL
jgi:hypothetical protein